MDFSKIRKKARERAAAREAKPAGQAAPAEAPPRAADRAAPDAAPPRAADRGEARDPPPPGPSAAGAEARAVEALEGELEARLLGAPALEDGFTTWRPGAGPAPRAVEPGPPPHEAAPARSEDFALFQPGGPPGSLPPALPAPAAPPRVLAPLEEFFYRDDEEAPEVPALGGAAEPAPGDEVEPAAREEYLTFLLGREEYAVAIERVREVVKAPPVTEVPRAPSHVLGVVTVRGEVVAVLDPRRRLGLPGAPPAGDAGRIVIVDAGEGTCGLLVDAVASVVRLPPGAIEPCPQGIGGSRAEYLAGIGRDDDRLFTVLDLGALLRRAPVAGRRAEEEGARAGR